MLAKAKSEVMVLAFNHKLTQINSEMSCLAVHKC